MVKSNDAAGESPKEQQPLAQALAGGPVRLLIVDDEKALTSMLVSYFELEGYVADAANDPYTALRMVHEGNYLVVISDITMPGMSGVELLRRIKKYNGMVQVIMITGYVTLDNILSCLRLGADECFLKPLDDLDALRGAVEDAVTKLRKWCRLLQDITQGRWQVGGVDRE